MIPEMVGVTGNEPNSICGSLTAPSYLCMTEIGGIIYETVGGQNHHATNQVLSTRNREMHTIIPIDPGLSIETFDIEDFDKAVEDPRESRPAQLKKWRKW